MLSRRQLNCVFIVFIGIVSALALSEVYLLYKLAQGNASWASSVPAIINLLFISAVGQVFLSISKKNFLEGTRLPVSSLKELAAEKARACSDPKLNDLKRRIEIMRAILNFARNRMPDWADGTHFEFCIFSDREYPTMVAYTDSAIQPRNRSMARREENPSYYRDKMYEAVKLLDSPQSQFHYIRDTRDPRADYTFIREEQKQQLRSSLLACTDTDSPVILVISSNRKEAFDLKDQDFDSFIRYIVEMIHEQTSDGKFSDLYRDEYPGLFVARA